MTRRTAAWTALALAALAAVVALLAGRPEARQLTVHLRCADAAAGQLSIAVLSGSGQPQTETAVDVGRACAAGRVVIERYRDDQSLRFRIVRGDGRTGESSARYGTDIQRDQDGFYCVLRVNAELPYLVNDRI